jgi:hypothetical protein
LKAWIPLYIALVLGIAWVGDNFEVLASNSTEVLPPKSNEDLTHQDKVLIKLSESGTTAEANVSPKNIMVKVGTTVVWENLLPEKVYVQSKPDANHYEGELLNGSYFFPGESREAKLDKVGTFIYDGSNGFGSYYVRGTITVVQEATEIKEIPTVMIGNQTSNSDIRNDSISSNTDTVDFQSTDLGLKLRYPSSWTAPIIPDYMNCFKNSDSCNVSFPLGYKTTNNTIENFVVGVRVNDLTMTGSSVSTDSFSTLNNACSCSTLEDYIKWDYNRLFSENDVIADNRTVLGNNYSAWQMEVFNKDNGYKTFVTWAINDNLGYRFIYSAPANNHYDYYLDEYKDLLNSVTFTKVGITPPGEVTESTVPKKPSFLSDANVESPNESSALNGTVNNTMPSTIPTKSDSENTTQSNTSQAKEAFKTYENPGFGLTLEYPPTWEVDELRSDPDEFSTDSIVVIFKSESQGVNDKYLENIIINVQGPRSDIKSLESYTQDSTQAFNEMSEINIIKSEEATLAGFPGHQIEYTSKGIPGLNLKKMQIFTVLDNVAYVVTYGAEDAEYDKNIADVENLINSIKINSGSNNEKSNQQINTAYSQQGTNEENDLVFEVQGLRTSPVVQKLEISGEVWEKVCPSNQCQVEEYDYSSYIVLPDPEDTGPRVYTSVYIYIRDDVTNKDLTPLQKNFAERYDLSFSCDVNSVKDIIEQGDTITYKCSSDFTSLSKENPEENDPTYYFNVEGTYETQNDTLTGTGEYDRQYP